MNEFIRKYGLSEGRTEDTEPGLEHLDSWEGWRGRRPGWSWHTGGGNRSHTCQTNRCPWAGLLSAPLNTALYARGTIRSASCGTAGGGVHHAHRRDQSLHTTQGFHIRTAAFHGILGTCGFGSVIGVPHFITVLWPSRVKAFWSKSYF